MSLETVKLISEAEKNAELSKEEASARCKEKLAAAQAQADEIVAQARARGEAEAEKNRPAEEEKLSAELRALVDNTLNRKAAIQGRAENHMDEAAALIAGRIVTV